MLDGDRDGQLHARDLADSYENILPVECLANTNYAGNKLIRHAQKRVAEISTIHYDTYQKATFT